MLHELYCIRDTKTEVYGKPFTQHARGEALRTATQVANDPQTLIGQYPEDYDLYYLGKYNDQDGAFKLEPSPSHVLKMITLKKLPAISPNVI